MEKKRTFNELSREEKIDALIESAYYLLNEFGQELFTSSDIEYIEKNKISEICERIYDNKDEVQELSKTAKEQIIDESIQYGIEFGY